MAALYLDADLSVKVIPPLIADSLQAFSASALGHTSATDDAQLEVAVRHGWILVTHNRKHFRLLHDAWHRFARLWAVEREHSGIIIARQAAPSVVAGDILYLLSTDVRLVNERYEWTPSRGWSRRPPPQEVSGVSQA